MDIKELAMELRKQAMQLLQAADVLEKREEENRIPTTDIKTDGSGGGNSDT